MLKQANELGNTLREIVRRDLADETRRFNDTLTQRIQLASEAIVQAVKAKEAIAAGASQLVIGRPITQASDPSAAFAHCCAELA